MSVQSDRGQGEEEPEAKTSPKLSQAQWYEQARPHLQDAATALKKVKMLEDPPHYDNRAALVGLLLAEEVLDIYTRVRELEIRGEIVSPPNP